MPKRTIIITGAAVAAVVGLGIAGSVAAGQLGDDGEQPITGDALVRASETALAHTGGGTVTETEVDDEDSKYEVEVTLDSGAQVDVQLDENFEVVGADADDDSSEDRD